MPAALFFQPPLIRFFSERTRCHCGAHLVVQKTRRKTVQSMTGPFIAHETLSCCLSCSRVYVPDALLKLVPKWGNVGYDVLVHVGRALFQRHRTINEVNAELYTCNVQLSKSEISYLGDKFIFWLAVCHQQAAPRIRQLMNRSGGYILHIDATHDGNAPTLMTGMDSLSKIVLGNVKIPSEHSDYIIPFLQNLQKQFGTPKACVHDMGKGICKGVTEVFPETLNFICHFHFLRDIGKDFLDPAYSSLRSSLRKHKTSSQLHALAREMKQCLSAQDFSSEVMAQSLLSGKLTQSKELLPLACAYSMTLWMLQGKHSGDGYGFPFDRPLLIFAESLLEGQQHLTALLDCWHDNDKIWKKYIVKLSKIVSDIINDTQCQQEVKELQWRCKVFDNLRKAMRIAPPDGKNGLNDDGADDDISTIRNSVQRFRIQLDSNSKWCDDKLCRKMAEQIDKWREKLFADPIEVESPQGTVLIYPQRTNNILEQFFRGIRRGQRRKTGNNSLRSMLQTMLADTPLVKNLDNDEYMRILFDGKENLEALFADLELPVTAKSTDSTAWGDRILPGFRKLIMQENLPVKITQLVFKEEIMAESN